MSTLLDIIGAGIIVGILLLSLFGLNVNLNQATYNKSFTLITQTNAVTLARMMEYDFVKMGYHVKPAILAAKSDSIAFKADLHNDGNIKTVQYFIGSTSALSFTKNPNDRMIFRYEGGSVIGANLGLTSLKFTYYNVDGIITSALDSIKAIDVKFTVESPEPVDTSYAAAFWQKKIYPKNL